MSHWYVLAEDGKTPVAVPDFETDPDGFKSVMWQKHSRDRWCVEKTNVGDVEVSTVFLFLDHRMVAMDDSGLPILWETMVFGDTGPLSEACERYTSWDEAKAGHDAMVKQVQRVTS